MFDWKDDYLIGLDEIDRQHHYFVALINRIERRAQAPVMGVGLDPLLAELTSYARFHFLYEENLMAEHGYPALAAHQLLHQALLGTLDDEQKMQELLRRGPGFLLSWLQEWFLHHTQQEDRAFANFVHSRGAD